MEAYLAEVTHKQASSPPGGTNTNTNVHHTVTFDVASNAPQEEVACVRKGIEILLTFCRGDSEDSGFIFEVSGWMEHLSAFLLTVASVEDHRFLMHTLLRCGRGMSAALTSIVQFPVDPTMWTPAVVDHTIACLHVLFSPPTDPDKPATDTGGPDFLSDTDYVALLERIPLATVLACVLRKGSDPEQVPRMFALIECMLEIVRGMFTDPVKAMYPRLATRAGRLISEIFAAV